jgi:hypothetical protein
MRLLLVQVAARSAETLLANFASLGMQWTQRRAAIGALFRRQFPAHLTLGIFQMPNQYYAAVHDSLLPTLSLPTGSLLSPVEHQLSVLTISSFDPRRPGPIARFSWSRFS